MQLRDVMTRNLEEIPPQMPLKDAAEKMNSCDIGALPVCENDKLVGILTDRDIAIRGVAQGMDPRKTPARQVMTPGVTWCYEDDDVKEAARIMEEKQIRRVLVFDRNKRAVGIVSLGDIATRLREDDELSAEVLQCVSEPAQPHA